MGIDGLGIANQAPEADFPLDGLPRLTLRMTARLQAFPDTWNFAGGKTAVYRQIGNAFPSLVAQAVGEAIMSALSGRKRACPQDNTPLFQASLFQSDELLQAVAE